MVEGDPGAGILLFLLLILTDMFFYGFSAALMALNSKEMEKRAQEDADKKAAKLLKIIDKPAKYIDTVQVVVSFVNIILGAVFIGNVFKGTYTVISCVVLLYLLLAFGVLLPKRIASRIPEKWAYAFINPMSVIKTLLYPMTALVSVTVKAVLYVFGIRDNADENDVTEEEIIDMVHEGHEQGIIQASEAQMISNIFEFGDKEVQDIMTHRNNMSAIDADTSLEDAVNFMLEGSNSRYPVYEENIDHIIGILHLKDAAKYHMDERMMNSRIGDLHELLREPCFVPQTKNIDELFREMQKKKLQMVIVVDEYGQTAGLAAMEDILEEIVGNIQDEYDEEVEHIEEKSDDEYIIEGMTPLEELEEKFGIEFDNDAYETLNGYLISKLDRIPEEDEDFSIDYCGYNFKILEVKNKMISSVQVTRLPEEKEDTDREVSRTDVYEGEVYTAETAQGEEEAKQQSSLEEIKE